MTRIEEIEAELNTNGTLHYEGARYLLDELSRLRPDAETVNKFIDSFLSESKALEAEAVALKLEAVALKQELERLDGARKDAVSALLAAQ